MPSFRGKGPNTVQAAYNNLLIAQERRRRQSEMLELMQHVHCEYLCFLHRAGAALSISHQDALAPGCDWLNSHVAKASI